MTDQELIEHIKKGNERAIDELYKKNYKMMMRLVTKNSGTEEEAQDVFQDALIVFWQRVQRPDFQLTSKISTFLYSICQNLWRKELDRKSRLSHESKDGSVQIDFEQQERSHLIKQCLQQLGETCRKVLYYYYFDELSMQDIAEKLGFANADTAKTKKYKCKKELDKLIKEKYQSSDFLDY